MCAGSGCNRLGVSGRSVPVPSSFPPLRTGDERSGDIVSMSLNGMGLGRIGVCEVPLGPARFCIGFLALTRTGGLAEPNTLWGVGRAGVAGKKGLNRNLGSSPTLGLVSETFRGEVEVEEFFAGEVVKRFGGIRRDGVAG